MIPFVLRNSDGRYFVSMSPNEYGIDYASTDHEIVHAQVFRAFVLREVRDSRQDKFSLESDPPLPECVNDFELVAIKIGEL